MHFRIREINDCICPIFKMTKYHVNLKVKQKYGEKILFYYFVYLIKLHI